MLGCKKLKCKKLGDLDRTVFLPTNGVRRLAQPPQTLNPALISHGIWVQVPFAPITCDVPPLPRTHPVARPTPPYSLITNAYPLLEPHTGTPRTAQAWNRYFTQTGTTLAALTAKTARPALTELMRYHVLTTVVDSAEVPEAAPGASLVTLQGGKLVLRR